MEDRPHLTARAWAKPRRSTGCFPLHLKSQLEQEKALLVQASAGQLDNNWLILFRFWLSAIPDEQDTIYTLGSQIR